MTKNEKAAIMWRVDTMFDKRAAYEIHVLLSKGLAGAGHKALSDALESDTTYLGLVNRWYGAYDMAEALIKDMTAEDLPRYETTIDGLSLIAVKYRLYSGKMSPADIHVDWYQLWTWAVSYDLSAPDWADKKLKGV